MKTINATIHTTLITSDDGLRTFEIIKKIDDCKGDSAYIISLYPTRCEQNIYNSDVTINYLVGRMTELDINELHIINLYSKVVNGKMSVRGLQIDEENMSYINNLMNDSKFQSSKFIIAWGSSFQSSSAINESKYKILQMYIENTKKSKAYQLSACGKSFDNDNMMHPLYIGIRCPNPWALKEFKITDNMLNEYKLKSKKSSQNSNKPSVSSAPTVKLK